MWMKQQEAGQPRDVLVHLFVEANIFIYEVAYSKP